MTLITSTAGTLEFMALSANSSDETRNVTFTINGNTVGEPQYIEINNLTTLHSQTFTEAGKIVLTTSSGINFYKMTWIPEGAVAISEVSPVENATNVEYYTDIVVTYNEEVEMPIFTVNDIVVTASTTDNKIFTISNKDYTDHMQSFYKVVTSNTFVKGTTTPVLGKKWSFNLYIPSSVETSTNDKVYYTNGILVNNGAAVEVYDVMGVCVARSHGNVDLKSMPKGVYIVRIDGSTTIKIAK